MSALRDRLAATAGRLRRLDDTAIGAWRRLRAADTAWEHVADVVTGHPVIALVAALAVLVGPLAALPSLRLSHDELAQLPASSPSVQGYRELSQHIPPGQLSPLTLVIEDDNSNVYAPQSMLALELLSRNLKQLDIVASVRSVAMPTDGRPPSRVAGGGDADSGGEQASKRIGQLTSRLGEAVDGARRLVEGVRRLEDGLARIDRRLPELNRGLNDATGGTERLGEGLDDAIDGVGRLRSGVDRLRSGLEELRSGLVRARDGATRLRTQVAEPTERSLQSGYDALVEMTVGRTDPTYERARREVGEAFARVTGTYPAGHPRAGQQVRDGYRGLPEALGELANGLTDAIHGTDRLRDGLGELDRGLADLGDGLRRARDGTHRLRDGLSRAEDGVGRLADGIDQLLTGVRERLLPGLKRLADGLARGAEQVRASDLEALIPTSGPGPFVVTPTVLKLRPDIKQQLDFFVADEDTRTRIFVTTTKPAYEREVIDSVERMRQVATTSLADSPLSDAQVLPTGTSAFFADMDEVASRDFRLILVAVIVGVYLVLAILLRSLVAPAYMVASVLLSFGVALGITTFVFQNVLGDPGIAWFIPPMMFVLLVALGVDYNIFLMSRVREEARRSSTRAAVATGLRLTGGVITSAGLILAGTFAALMLAPLRSLAQIGFAVTVGILLDTFIVRSLVVPATAVLLGEHNWWPSSLANNRDATSPGST